MKTPWFLALLFVVCLTLATTLQPEQARREQVEGRSGDVLALLFGDGRKMIASQFFAKADAYFHRGNYPSIFEINARRQENHMTGEAGHDSHPAGAEHPGEPAAAGAADEPRDHADHEEPGEAGKPRDWIERFGRHFYATEHVHLTGSEAREMLPWLKLSAEMDPHRAETYIVTAYWLRARLGKVDEAERFLREGLKSNPGNPELLFELGRIQFENRTNLVTAKNLWASALKRWHEVEGPKEKPDTFILQEILGGLVRIELGQGRVQPALEYLEQWKAVSPNPAAIQAQIDALRQQP